MMKFGVSEIIDQVQNKEQRNAHQQGISHRIGPIRDCGDFLIFQIGRSYREKLDPNGWENRYFYVDKADFPSFDSGFLPRTRFIDLLLLAKKVKLFNSIMFCQHYATGSRDGK